MTVKTFMTDNLEAMRTLIATKLPAEKFDSHGFIAVFAKEFESDYIAFLSKYETKKFRSVNAQIASNLLKLSNDLKIQNNGKVKSQSIFGNEVDNEEWLKIT